MVRCDTVRALPDFGSVQDDECKLGLPKLAPPSSLSSFQRLLQIMAPVSTSRSASAASAATRGGPVLAGDVESFATYLASCDRILALLGAGLSAGSGLPTFRGAGGLWRRHDAMSLATPEAFSANPALVWQFYNYRRHMALTARPNRAHRALAALAKSNPNFVTLTQNVDGTPCDSS